MKWLKTAFSDLDHMPFMEEMERHLLPHTAISAARRFWKTQEIRL